MNDIKKKLRKEMMDILAELLPEERERSDKAIVTGVLSLPEYINAGCVFLYYGVGWEIDTRPLIQHALDNKKRVALPLCFKGGIMEAREIFSLSDLVPGSYKGIPEPRRDSLKINRNEIDMALVPCVCADRKRYRLGQGGGYYDRFLKDRSFFAATLCRGTALLEAVPADKYDVQTDLIITDTGII